MRRPRGEAGALAPLLPVLGFVLLLLGGLIVDASRLLTARGRAVAYAQEAARAGASAVVLGRSVLTLDEPLARRRVQDYCDAILADDTQRGGVTVCQFRGVVAVGGGDDRRLVVRVFVQVQIPASLLGLVGVRTLTASGPGSARPFEGVDPRDVDSSPPPVEVPVPDSPPPLPPGVDLPGIPTVPLPSPLPSPATPTVVLP